MVKEPPPRQRGDEGEGRPIVAFDFDGTLTVEDSYAAFLKWTVGRLGWMARLPLLAPPALAYLVHRDRGRLKQTVTRHLLGGQPLEAVRARAERFAEFHFDRLLRPDALARWLEHQRDGALLVIVTATPDVVVEPFARRLGADALLGTRLVVSETGEVTGTFLGENCRAQEKVRRLRERFGEDVQLTAAYGDSSGDTEMLALAAEPGMKVFQARP
ncbi:MAG TPA: HAD-IB family hydrolase [Caulobacteraceae bacterium]|jgi:phosphatidylglycerophosphatase C